MDELQYLFNMNKIGRRTLLKSVCAGVGTTVLLSTGASGSSDQEPDPDEYEKILDEMAGDGSVDDPYIVTDVAELQAMDGDRSAHFELGTDIDADETRYWNSGDGYESVGWSEDEDEWFSGTLDGRGYTINNLYIDSYGHTGLFSHTNNALIKNVGVENVRITATSAVGGLIGEGRKTEVENCYTTGDIDAISRAGGLIGWIDRGEITACHSTVDIQADSHSGGLVAVQESGRIEHSYASGDVSTGPGLQGHTGGLVGLAGWTADGGTPTIEQSFAEGDVSGAAPSIGGLVGATGNVIIKKCYATGNVDGTRTVGGLTGNVSGGTLVADSFATGAVTGNHFVGGLVGGSIGRIHTSYATGAVEGSSHVGGFIGQQLDGFIHYSYATGRVSGGEYIGGFLGDRDEDAEIRNLYWDLETSGVDESAGGRGLHTDEMTGEDATNNMYRFFTDGVSTAGFTRGGWKPVVDPDDYPVPEWQQPEVESAILATIFEVPEKTTDEQFSIGVAIRQAAAVAASDVTVTVTVRSPTESVYEETVSLDNVSGQSTVRFGVDNGTGTLGPFETTGEYTVTATATAANAESVETAETVMIADDSAFPQDVFDAVDQSGDGEVSLGELQAAVEDWSANQQIDGTEASLDDLRTIVDWWAS